MASVDENGRRIICLANSRKPDGRCIAGKLYFQGKFGKWLRPISAREGEELSEVERLVGPKTEPAMLDILEFSIIAAKPSHHQTENWIINPKVRMQKVGSILPKDLMLALDKPINLEANDIIRIVAAINPDSSSPDVEAFASILEIA